MLSSPKNIRRIRLRVEFFSRLCGLMLSSCYQDSENSRNNLDKISSTQLIDIMFKSDLIFVYLEKK